jgi:hypothetical protein
MTGIQRTLINTITSVHTSSKDARENLLFTSIILARIPKKQFRKLERIALKQMYR